MTVAICKNCKYFKPNNSEPKNILNGFCTHPSVRIVNIITGETTNKYASDVRDNEEMCGKKGRLFKPESHYIVCLKLIGKNEFFALGYIGLISLIVIRGHQVGIGNLELISGISALSYVLFLLKFFINI